MMGPLTKGPSSAEQAIERTRRLREAEAEREADAAQNRADREQRELAEARERRLAQEEGARQRQQELTRERERLRSNLQHAEAALASCAGGADLSSEEAAIASLDGVARRLAAEWMVAQASRAVEGFERQLARR